MAENPLYGTELLMVFFVLTLLMAQTEMMLDQYESLLARHIKQQLRLNYSLPRKLLRPCLVGCSITLAEVPSKILARRLQFCGASFDTTSFGKS